MKTTLPRRQRARFLGLLSLALLTVGSAPAQLLVRNTPREKGVEPTAEPTRQTTVGLTDLLDRLKETHHVFFLYDQEKLQGKQVKTDRAQLKDVEKTLNRVLPPLKLHYKKLDAKNYVILATDQEAVPGSSALTPEAPGESRTATDDLALLASQEPGLLAMAVERRVSGRVSSAEDGAGLPGVSVRVKDGTVGTVTNTNGEFNLSVPDNAAALVFSSVGYVTQEVGLTGLTVLEVRLAVDQKNLDEVVVVGYGAQRRSDLTGAVASVKGSDLKNLPATDLATALQGRVPGAYVTSNGGGPGEGSQIIIRGPVSINGGSPLYVVDGIPFQGTGFNFNIQDIESIEVLKDASASAIYGAQAAAGVILITTKKGKAGTMKVGFNASYGVRNVLNLPQTLRRDEYIRAKKAFGFDVVDLYGPATAWSQLPDTDWFNEIHRPATEQNYTLSLSGGGEKSRFYLSGNYANLQGVRIGNDVGRYTLRINTDHQISKRLRFSQTLYGRYGQDHGNNATNQGNLSFRNTPVMLAYDPTNPIGGWGRAPRGFQGGNDVASALNGYRNGDNYEVTLGGTLDYELLKGLNLRATLGTTQDGGGYYFYNPRADVGTSVSQENFGRGLGKGQKYIATYTATYGRTFGAHEVKGLVGYEARRENYANVDFNNSDPLVPRPQSSGLVKNVNTAQGGFGQSDIYNRILSQFARLEYSFSGKYLLTVNVRRDGIADKFGPNKKIGMFPGVSAGWKISDEAFMRTLPFVSFLKLRGGYGVLGNSNIGSFSFSNDYSRGFAYDFGTGRQSSVGLSSKLANPDIQWEEVATANVGLDGGLLNNKLTFNLDYYSRQTRKMLYGVGISPSAGLGGEVPANIGQMSNKGVEINLEWKDKVGSLTYGVGLNGGFNRNKLVSLNPDLGRQTLTAGYIGQNSYPQGRSVSRSEPGLALAQFYGLQAEGIYQTDAASGETRPTVNDYKPRAGDLIYKDLNGDGKINDDDRTYIGTPWPKLTYGINLTAAWKGFDVRAFFAGVAGNQIYNVFESYEHMFYSDYTTTAKIFETSGFNGNGVTAKPRVGTLDDLDRNGNWANISSYHVQSGSYLRLKNLQIGYSLPAPLLNRLRMSSLRVFVMGDNLLTFTKYKGINPELAGSSNFRDWGIDNSDYRYPTSRLLSLGLNAEF